MATEKTMKDIKEWLRQRGHSSVVANMIERLAGEFPTIDSFFAATKGALMGLYNKSESSEGTPRERSLGERFFRAYDDARAYWTAPDKPPCAKRDARDVLLEHELTIAEVCKVKDFMEMFGVKALTFAKIANLLDLCGNAQAEEKSNGQQKGKQ